MFLNVEHFVNTSTDSYAGANYQPEANFNGLSRVQLLHCGGQALFVVANLHRFLGLFKTLGDLSINNLLFNVHCCPDQRDPTIREQPRTMFNGLHSFRNIFCYAISCILEAYGA